MELKRNYLTSDELISIVNELVEHESAVERHILAVSMTAQCLVEDLKHYETCNEIYDKLMEENIDLEMEVENFYQIEKLTNKELSVDNGIKIFLEHLEEKLKDFNLEDNIRQLKGVINNASK